MPACRQTLPAAASLPPSSVLLANPRLGQPRVVLLGLGPGCCCSQGGREGGREGGETRHGAVSWNRLVQATLLGEYQRLRQRKIWTSQSKEKILWVWNDQVMSDECLKHLKCEESWWHPHCHLQLSVQISEYSSDSAQCSSQSALRTDSSLVQFSECWTGLFWFLIKGLFIISVPEFWINSLPGDCEGERRLWVILD